MEFTHNLPSRISSTTGSSASSTRRRYHPWDFEGNAEGSSRDGSPRAKRDARKRQGQRFRKIQAVAEELRDQFPFLQVGLDRKATRKINPKPEFALPSPFFSQFLATREPGYLTGIDLDSYCFFKACDAAQMKHLEYFNRPPNDYPLHARTVVERAKAIVKSLIDDGRRYPFPDLLAVPEVKFKPNKYPGKYYANKGYKTRKEADDEATGDAVAAFRELLSGHHVEPHAVRLGGRGKVVEMSRAEAVEKGVVKGRLILMESQRDLKLLGVTESIITNHCKAPSIPIFVGDSWYFRGSQRFCTHLREFEEFYCYDAEKFDAAIDPWMVDEAIDIVRHLFQDGHNEVYDQYWLFVKESLLESVIVRDDGIRFKKFVGTTSGHNHNTILQSIITLMAGYSLLIELNPTLSNEQIMDDSYVAGLGDDNLIARGPSLRKFTCEEGAEVVMGIWKINWFGSKSFSTTRIWDFKTLDFEGVQFLGKFFRAVLLDAGDNEVTSEVDAISRTILPYRPLVETVVRLYYPEREPSKIALDTYSRGNLEYMRAVGHYIDAAGNPPSRRILDDYLNYLEDLGYKEAAPMGAKLEHILFGSGDNHDLPCIDLTRFAWTSWLDLVMGERAAVIKVLAKPGIRDEQVEPWLQDEDRYEQADPFDIEDLGFMEY